MGHSHFGPRAPSTLRVQEWPASCNGSTRGNGFGRALRRTAADNATEAETSKSAQVVNEGQEAPTCLAGLNAPRIPVVALEQRPLGVFIERHAL